MRRLCMLFTFLVISLLNANVQAGNPIQPKLKIGYGVAEGFIEEDTTGVGAAVMKAVATDLEKIGYEIELIKAPFNRIVSQYANGHLDVAFPIISGDYMSLDYFKKWKIPFIPLYSMPIYNGGTFAIFTPVEEPVYHGVSELKNFHIGVLAGVYMPNELKAPTGYKVTEIHGRDRAIKLLRVGRIDALVLHKNWADAVLSEDDLEKLHHGESFSHIYGSFATQPTSNGAVILAEINKILATMVLDGRYKAVLDQHENIKSIIPYGR